MIKSKSLLRREEYKSLRGLALTGKILDVGGSKKSGYHELIGGDHVITVGNIDESYGIDIVFDAEKEWPFPDASYNGVLLVNILEHLYSYQTAVREANRVLLNSGTLAGVVPFMFNVHGSPSDHFRYTRFALERMLCEAGFTEIEIKELGTGAFSVIYHCLLGFVRWNWMADILIPIFTGLDKFFAVLVPNNKMSATYMPLGYYFTAKKY